MAAPISDDAIKKRLKELRSTKNDWLEEVEEAEQRIQQLRRQAYE
jgi:prefoldin subunit 5